METWHSSELSSGASVPYLGCWAHVKNMQIAMVSICLVGCSTSQHLNHATDESASITTVISRDSNFATVGTNHGYGSNDPYIKEIYFDKSSTVLVTANEANKLLGYNHFYIRPGRYKIGYSCDGWKGSTVYYSTLDFLPRLRYELLCSNRKVLQQEKVMSQEEFDKLFK